MSSEGQGSREWRFYVTDMIEFCEKILTYTKGMDQAAFVADALTYDASLRNLELEISWRTITGARNRLAHAYLSVDDDLIWDIIQNDIPKLLAALRDLLDTTSKDFL